MTLARSGSSKPGADAGTGVDGSQPQVRLDAAGHRTVSWSARQYDGELMIFTHDCPDAVQHHYTPGDLNEDLRLYEGGLAVDGDDGYVGDVRWRWGRTPRIEVRGQRREVRSDLGSLASLVGTASGRWTSPSAVTLPLLGGSLPPAPAPAPAVPADPETVRSAGSSRLTRRVEQQLGSPSALEQVTFLVPNGWDGMDATCVTSATDLTRLWHGRTEAAGGGWQVTFDRLADMDAQAWRSLRDSGGHQFTHTGRLRRTDGTTFTGEEAFYALDRIRLGLNLALGRRTTCALPVGWREGQPVWCRWRSAPVDPHTSSSHWLDDTLACQQVAQLVSLVLDFTVDEANLAALRPAVAYYVAGNVDVEVELAVAVPLSALQLLAYYRFVEQRHTFSQTQWKAKTTGDQVRLLLDDLQVDPAVQPHFQYLVAVQERLKAAAVGAGSTGTAVRYDALDVAVKMRNVVTHPTRDRPSTFDVYAWAEAGMHVRYWLCLALLGTVGYVGQVRAAMEEQPPWTGQVRPVPWSP